MTYGLPARGQNNWDDELNNSIESLHSDVQSAVSNAATAVSTANTAKNTADDALATANSSGDAAAHATSAAASADSAALYANGAQASAAAAQAARTGAETAQTAAQAVGNSNDAIIASRINDTTSATRSALNDSIAQLATWARNPDLLVAGTVTRDANGAATSAPVVWPNGQPGTYTADTISTAFPGAVDAYHITYGSPVTKTFTQPTITRDATTGAATNVPAIVVS